jgi:hypothetical protein
MKPTYWVEMTLNVSGGQAAVDELVAGLDESHKGQIAYTFSHADGQLALAMSTVSDEAIEMVAARVVGTVRAAAHELGFHTPGWPEPVAIDDVRIKVLTAEIAAC